MTNVLVVMSDQHNPKVLGCAGHPIVRTPNLDALAASGTRFTSAYTNSPICVPARAAWATGRYVHETGCWDNATAYEGEPPGWGHALQAAGVRVESIGKLHYRNADAPTGFDRQLNPMHLAGGIGQVWGSVRNPLPVRKGAELLVSWSGPGESDYTRYDRATTDLTCDWLAERGESPDEPWVLYVGLVAPHHPWIAPQEFFDLYDPSTLERAKLHPDDGYERHPWVQAYSDMLSGLDSKNTEEERQRCTAAYYGLVSYMDHNVGRIVDALEAAGLRDDTLIVYTTDHGDTLGSRGLWGKTVLYQESAGIPLIVSGPAVPSGELRDTPVSHVDGYQTILGAAGVEPAPGDDADRPGRSWVDLANEPDDPERVAFAEYHAMGASSAAFLVRKGRYKLHHYLGYEPELFDLEADPEETTNLAGDPAHAGALQELQAVLRTIVDPEDADRRAREAQAALLDRFGGREQALRLGTVAETPVPEDATTSG